MNSSAPEKSEESEWEKIHDYVREKTSTVINSIHSADVDWFLRDTNVSLSEQPPTQSKQPPAAAEASAAAAAALQTPSSPHLAVSNSNKSNSSKTRPSVSSIQEEDVHPNAFQESAANPPFTYARRRGSVSSIASTNSAESTSSGTGGFFSKLKNRLQRTESNVSAQPPSPIQAPATPFKQDYNMAKVNSRTFDYSEFSKSASPETELGKASAEESAQKSEIVGDPRLQAYVKMLSQKPKKSCYKRPPGEPHIAPVVETEQRPPPEAQHSKLSSIFRKMSMNSPSAPEPEKRREEPSASGGASRSSSDTTADKPLPAKPLKPLKHVAFHSQTFLIDPPQQIPSRTPRKGNVEILPSGKLQINPLTEQDKNDIEKSLRGQGGGLVVGGTGALGLMQKDPDPPTEYKEHDENPESGEGDTEIDQHAKTLGVEKPMMHSTTRTGYSAPVKKMALDVMYTRCCHLREILPIPAISKQIPPGSMAPLTLLQLRNPTPTLVEIQTFADFIRIAPIICISLDGVSLSLEQFSILLSAMCAKTQLEKLSLRNTPIDADGWALLCSFLSRNKALNRLDITQCPPLSVNVLKKKKKSKPEEEAVKRMECNRENRSDMDWALFTAALMVRGGVEELILTGCCITDIADFESLMTKAVSLRTFKLGLAYNQLTPQHLTIVLDSWFFLEESRGLDLGYNDFSSPKYLKVFLDHFQEKNYAELIAKSNIAFLSLNATNLRFGTLFKEFYEKYLIKLPNLKYLDISNSPKLFGTYDGSGKEGVHDEDTDTKDDTNQKDDASATPSSMSSSMKEQSPESIVSYFCSHVLTFQSLVRLHMDNNGFTSKSLSVLFESAPFCKTLSYLSVIGNHLDVYSAATLLQCLKNSSSLVAVDADFTGLPEIFRERVGLYTMRNMDHFMSNGMLKDSSESDSGSSKKTRLQDVLSEELNAIITRNPDKKLDTEAPEVKHLVHRIQHYRKVLKLATGDLFYLQYKGQLNMEGKEALIRLLYIDSSLERGLSLISGSLVKEEDSFTASDIININLAEDERNELKLSSLSKAQNVDSDNHTLLSPIETSALPASRGQSFTNLSSLDKEEGSVMKLSSLSRLTNNESLFDNFRESSGEELRQILSNGDGADIDKIIKYLQESFEKGGGLKKLYDGSQGKKRDEDLVSEIRQKFEHFKRQLPQGDVASDAATSSGPAEKDPMQEREREQGACSTLNEAYDRILRSFEK